MKNIEIKLKVPNFIDIITRMKKIGAMFQGRLRQIDTYFNIGHGRLKLREINGKSYELILYDRPQNTESRVSTYTRVPVAAAEQRCIKKIFAGVFGIRVVVRKERDLWIYKHTRIHLDMVRGLGNYLELETVISGIDFSAGKREHAEIKASLGLSRYKNISVSYENLVRRGHGR